MHLVPIATKYYIIYHLHVNTHPCGSCTRNVHFVVRSNRSEIFIVFCMLRSWGPWILRIFDPILLFHRGFLKILDLHFSFLRWDPGDPGRILIGYSICKGKLYHRLKKKHSGVGVEAAWSTPSPTLTPGSLSRLRATPTPTRTPTPHPCYGGIS